MDVRETLARVFYLTSKKMLAQDNRSSLHEYLQATFLLQHKHLHPLSGLA